MERRPPITICAVFSACKNCASSRFVSLLSSCTTAHRSVSPHWHISRTASPYNCGLTTVYRLYLRSEKCLIGSPGDGKYVAIRQEGPCVRKWAALHLWNALRTWRERATLWNAISVTMYVKVFNNFVCWVGRGTYLTCLYRLCKGVIFILGGPCDCFLLTVSLLPPQLSPLPSVQTVAILRPKRAVQMEH